MADAKKAVKRIRKTAPAEKQIASIKGFNRDLTCNGYQFELGKTYEHAGSVKCCREGFHACTTDAHPLEVFGYYAPGLSRYCEVIQSGALDSNDDVKIASAKITIGLEISITELTKRAIEWVFSRAKKAEGSQCDAEAGAASATGYQGAASATGDYGAASATGSKGAASATGDYGAASATGFAGQVSGKDGNAIFAVEREPREWKIVSAACGIVGRDGIEADTWYVCKDGKLVQAEVEE